MKCPEHCPSPAGLPWRWILLAIAVLAFAAFMTWLFVTYGRAPFVISLGVLMVVVTGFVWLIVLNAIENSRRSKEAKPWKTAPSPAAQTSGRLSHLGASRFEVLSVSWVGDTEAPSAPVPAPRVRHLHVVRDEDAA